MSTIDTCRDDPTLGSGFVHQAAFYRGPEGLLSQVLPFVRDGVARGEPVLVAMAPARLTQLEAALGPDATRVDFVDMTELGANPACIIPEWRRFLTDAGLEGPVRGVGEPVWPGRRDVEVEEALLHEVLLDVAFDETDLRMLCPYDVTALPAPVVAEARRVHGLVEGAGSGGSAKQPGRGRPARETASFGAPLPPAPGDADECRFGPGDLAGLRHVVGRLAGVAGLGRAATDDLVLAAHELATNSVIHGGGSGLLRAWVEPGAFVVEVCDAGVIDDPLVGRDLLHDFAENGRGVWLANQLCDLVQVRSGRAGTVVRLHSWL